MDYDLGLRTYRLVSSLAGDPFAPADPADLSRYQPRKMIVQRPWSLRQRRLLLR